MSVLKSARLHPVENIRDLRARSGVVAARVRAYQSAQSFRADPHIDVLEHRSVDESSRDTENSPDDVYYCDTILSSPKSTVPADDIRRDRQNEHTMVKTHCQAPSPPHKEEEKAYSRHIPESKHAFKVPGLEQNDGTIELRTAKSRLRPITERKETRSKNEKEPNLTMDDLGSMLEDAIVQTAESPTTPVAHTPSQSEVVGRSISPAQPRSKSPSENARQRQDLTRDDDSDVRLLLAKDHDIPQMKSDLSTYPMSTITEHHGRDIAPEPVGTSADLPTERPRSSTNVFQRYNSQSRPKQSDFRKQCSSPIRAESNLGTLRLGSSPVKQKAALWEALTDKPSLVDNSRVNSIAHDSQRKGDWSLYQRSNEGRPTRSGHKASSHRRILSNPHSGSDLIPLTLPRLVKRATSQNRAGSTSGTQSDYFGKEAVYHAIRDGVNPLEAMSGGNVSPKSRAESVLGESAKHFAPGLSVLASPAIVDETTQTSRLPRSVSKWPLKENLHHRFSVTSRQSLGAPVEAKVAGSGQARSSRPSIVEGKISELMAASKQTEDGTKSVRHSNHDAGQVKQSSIVGSIADTSSINTKHLPAVQMPIDEQAKALRPEPDPFIRVPSMLPTGHNTFSTETCSEPFVSPMKADQSAPSTPIRGRPKTVKQAFSQRGMPYAFEQRFSLSPSRSRSRCDTSSVRVSVEVRNSPEKTRAGLDEHEVIVRATVEPDELSDDGEE